MVDDNDVVDEDADVGLFCYQEKGAEKLPTSSVTGYTNVCCEGDA